jgi:hypothetical protein
MSDPPGRQERMEGTFLPADSRPEGQGEGAWGFWSRCASTPCARRRGCWRVGGTSTCRPRSWPGRCACRWALSTGATAASTASRWRCETSRRIPCASARAAASSVSTAGRMRTSVRPSSPSGGSWSVRPWRNPASSPSRSCTGTRTSLGLTRATPSRRMCRAPSGHSRPTLLRSMRQPPSLRMRWDRMCQTSPGRRRGSRMREMPPSQMA